GERVRLRIISPRFARVVVAILREQPRIGAPRQHLFKERARFVLAANERQRLDVPERAEVERRLRRAEIVLLGIAQQILAAAQVLLERFERREETLVVRRDEARVHELQQARIHLRTVETAREAAKLFVPSALQNGRAYFFRTAAPERFAVI